MLDFADYFKRIHADAATLSAEDRGILSHSIPLHTGAPGLEIWSFGLPCKGCRKMDMSVVARTDPHAVRQQVYDLIRLDCGNCDGEKRNIVE